MSGWIKVCTDSEIKERVRSSTRYPEVVQTDFLVLGVPAQSSPFRRGQIIGPLYPKYPVLGTL